MARKLQNQTNVEAPSGDYPSGRIKDDTGAADGTPVEEKVYGDIHQFFDQLARAADITLNDLPDNTTNGFQLFQALDNFVFVPIKQLHGLFNERLGGEDFGSGDLTFPTGIFIIGGKAYITDSTQAEVVVFDLATGANIPLEDFGIGDLTAPEEIFIIGNKAYVVDSSQAEIVVFDITTGANIPSEDFGSGDLTTPEDIFIIGNKAYVVDSSQGEVVVFDIITGANLPAEDFGLADLSSPRDIFIANGKAYVSDVVQDEIVVFDVATTLHLPGEDFGGGLFINPFGLFVIGNKIYIADNGNEIFTFDRTTGVQLIEEGFADISISPRDLQIVNNKAYLLSTTLDKVFVFNQNLLLNHI